MLNLKNLLFYLKYINTFAEQITLKTKEMSIQETMKEVAQAEIEALRKEVFRLNEELKKIKQAVFMARVSDPNFDKPLNQIETNYEQITADVYRNS